MEPGNRVRLINPGGYDNYQGTLVSRVDGWPEAWWRIAWDVPGHPCTSPMEEKHLEEIK